MQQWMCDAVVLAVRPLNTTLTRIRCVVVSSVTNAPPVPGEALAGFSLGPDSDVEVVMTAPCADAASASQVMPTASARNDRFMTVASGECPAKARCTPLLRSPAAPPPVAPVAQRWVNIETPGGIPPRASFRRRPEACVRRRLGDLPGRMPGARGRRGS